MVNSRSCVKHVDVYLERMDTCKRERGGNLFLAITGHRYKCRNVRKNLNQKDVDA